MCKPPRWCKPSFLLHYDLKSISKFQMHSASLGCYLCQPSNLTTSLLLTFYPLIFYQKKPNQEGSTIKKIYKNHKTGRTAWNGDRRPFTPLPSRAVLRDQWKSRLPDELLLEYALRHLTLIVSSVILCLSFLHKLLQMQKNFMVKF